MYAGANDARERTMRTHIVVPPIHAVLVAILLSPASAAAQATPAQQPPEPPPPHEGSAEVSFVGTSGNSSTTSIGLGGDVIARPDPWELSARVAYVRNEAESDLKAESLALTTRVARKLTPRTSAFVRYLYLHDRFAGIESRNGIEGGLSYLLIDAAPHKLIVDGGIGYAHETRVVPPNLSSAVVPAGALYTYTLSKTAEISDDGRFVFSLADSADWRFANIASVTAKLTTLLSLKLANTVRFVNAPAFGFEKTDTITAIALVAKF
jgi:putative salt-induced outer membrane protein